MVAEGACQDDDLPDGQCQDNDSFRRRRISDGMRGEVFGRSRGSLLVKFPHDHEAMMRVRDLRFTHDSVAGNFRDGRNLECLLQDLCTSV